MGRLAEEPRYGFHPLERRGLLLGLDAGQLLTLAGGVVTALAVHTVLAGPIGAAAAAILFTGGAAAALWTRQGRPLVETALTATAWTARRATVRLVDDSPTQGQVLGGGGPCPRPSPRRGPGTRPPGLDLVEDAGVPGDTPLGVVRDRRAGTWAAVIPVRGCSFALLDPPVQAQRLEGWRRVLGSLGRPGSPVVRVQWVQRSWTGPAEAPGGALERAAGDQPGGAVSAADVSYRELVGSFAAGFPQHRAWLVLVVRPSQPNRRAPGSAGRAVADLRREMRLVEGQLRSAELEPEQPLDLCQLTALIAGSGRPERSPGRRAWALAADEGWSAYRSDGDWHVTYWIAEWPRQEVGPDFLAPLLVGPARTAVSVLMAPVPTDRALREVRSARTADVADAELRARAGFLQSARRDRESEGVARREAELADGHQEFRFSGYVTVSAGDRDELAAACAAAEHAAQSARLELRRLFGRQAEAYTWTLPVGRGLR